MSHHMELREWLVKHQRFCPSTRLPVTIHDHLHHLFLRRNPDREFLYCPLNMVLCKPEAHVPEAPDLNYLCALQKWTMGFMPGEVRDWIDGLPFKVHPGYPSFFIEAETDYEKGD